MRSKRFVGAELLAVAMAIWPLTVTAEGDTVFLVSPPNFRTIVTGEVLGFDGVNPAVSLGTFEGSARFGYRPSIAPDITAFGDSTRINFLDPLQQLRLRLSFGGSTHRFVTALGSNQAGFFETPADPGFVDKSVFVSAIAPALDDVIDVPDAFFGIPSSLSTQYQLEGISAGGNWLGAPELAPPNNLQQFVDDIAVGVSSSALTMELFLQFSAATTPAAASAALVPAPFANLGFIGQTTTDFEVVVVPLPATWSLLGFALGGMGGWQCHRARATRDA